VFLIRADPTDFRREVNQNIPPGGVEHSRDGCSFCQIELALTGDEHPADAAFLELRADHPSEEPRPAGYADSLMS
jgi:hypothetical protein